MVSSRRQQFWRANSSETELLVLIFHSHEEFCIYIFASWQEEFALQPLALGVAKSPAMAGELLLTWYEHSLKLCWGGQAGSLELLTSSWDGWRPRSGCSCSVGWGMSHGSTGPAAEGDRSPNHSHRRQCSCPSGAKGLHVIYATGTWWGFDIHQWRTQTLVPEVGCRCLQNVRYVALALGLSKVSCEPFVRVWKMVTCVSMRRNVVEVSILITGRWKMYLMNMWHRMRFHGGVFSVRVNGYEWHLTSYCKKRWALKRSHLVGKFRKKVENPYRFHDFQGWNIRWFLTMSELCLLKCNLQTKTKLWSWSSEHKAQTPERGSAQCQPCWLEKITGQSRRDRVCHSGHH